MKLRNEKGQATMEAVLLMIVFVSIGLKLSNIAKEQGFLRNIVEGPWSPMRGMIEDGVWMRHTISKSQHPNQIDRHQSTAGQSGEI
ncbi:MAG: hypothetical protein RBT63_05200 [Bdellovibrionales bacterium]|jgi:hypothetical protein|nr:hypothetical protein [Bdellovibrionales bacterium]